jgi:hypothetical protein
MNCVKLGISVKTAYKNNDDDVYDDDDDDNNNNNNNNNGLHFHYPISLKRKLPVSLSSLICACIHFVFQEHAIRSRPSTWSP